MKGQSLYTYNPHTHIRIYAHCGLIIREKLDRSKGTVQYSILMTYCKGTVSRAFLPLFLCSKDSSWAPYEQAKTVSRRNSILALVTPIIIFLNYCYSVCKHTQILVLPHCPKSMRVFRNMVRSVDENNSNDTEYSQLFFRTMLRKVLCSL